MELVFDIDPDEWQKKLLDRNPNKALLLCSRQAGKSTVSAAIALHEAVYNNDALVLIVSKSYRQACELFRKVKTGLRNLSDHLEILHETQSSIELRSGSRIVSLPGKEDTIRSFSSVALLVVDEASQVSDELYATVKPMLAISQGKILGLSTPYGKKGWFYNSWVSDNDWYKVRITADDCPRITKEFIASERQEIGDWFVRQEYYCEFMDSEDQMFNYDDIEASISDDVKPLRR